MPPNAAGEFIWIKGLAHAYVFVEGSIDSCLDQATILSLLGGSLERCNGAGFDAAGFCIPNNEIFKWLLVRDGKCALVATMPLDLQASSIGSQMGRLVAEVGHATDLIHQALQLHDLSCRVVLEAFNCQCAVPY